MYRARDHREAWAFAGRLLVLAAIPTALYTLTGNPIPSQWWSRDDVQTWWASVQMYPSQALDILPRILVDALWIAWAWYATWFALAMLWTLLHLPSILMPRILLRLTPRTTVQAITVTLTCRVDLSQEVVAGFPGSETLRATFTSPVDTYVPTLNQGTAP